eukprot:1522145-Rhodomonas_salina.1
MAMRLRSPAFKSQLAYRQDTGCSTASTSSSSTARHALAIPGPTTIMEKLRAIRKGGVTARPFASRASSLRRFEGGEASGR